MEAAKPSRGSAGQANIRWLIVYMKDDLCVNFGACIRRAKFNPPIALPNVDETSLKAAEKGKCFAAARSGWPAGREVA
jgi:hypothetical protein